MKMKIMKISLENFKGAKHKEIVLDGQSARLCGENGSGKSTIATAVSWVLSDSDYNLVKNPDVVPLGEEECNPTVELEMTIDDKPIKVKRVQKYKRKEVDGKITAETSNTYYINDIAKSKRDFIADLEERGLDVENYMVYSNPNAFTADTSAKGRQQIRDILFKMAGEFTDEDIAVEIGADNVAEQLETYKLEEIKASAKSTIARIINENGKDNVVINSKISGMLDSKSTLDEKVLNQQKKEYEAEINRCEKELESLAGSKADIHERISELRIKRDDITSKANQELNEKKTELDKSIRELQAILDEKNFKLSQTKTEIERQEGLLTEKKESIEKQRILYKVEQDAVIDEGDLSCPVCHRTYDEEKIAEIKADFTKHKAEKLKVIKASGEDLKKNIKSIEKEIKTLKDQQQALDKVIAETIKMRDAKQAEIDKLPVSADMFMIDNFVVINNEIADLEKQLSADDDARKKELESAKNVAKTMLHQIVAEIGALEHNKEIDKQIQELREKRKNDEIAKANAEKLIDEVESVERAKNQKLADSINEHFELVEWHLWDLRKNGEYVEITEPYIDGKPMTSCANGSLISLAKISICADLQKFFEQTVPVWCDDASLFSKNTIDRLKIDTQFIQLIVADGVKDLKVKKEK